MAFSAHKSQRQKPDHQTSTESLVRMAFSAGGVEIANTDQRTEHDTQQNPDHEPAIGFEEEPKFQAALRGPFA